MKKLQQLFKLSLLFTMSQLSAVLVINDSSQTLYLKLGTECLDLYNMPAVILQKHNSIELEQPKLPPQVCLLMQAVDDNESEIYLFKLPNLPNILIKVFEDNGKISLTKLIQ